MFGWVISYFINIIFWLWIVRCGGAEWIEDKVISAFLVNYFAYNWIADGIKFYAWCALGISTILFILGGVFQDFRLFSFL